jgi:hypothetical protein
MSLEDALAANTAAITAHTAALKALAGNVKAGTAATTTAAAGTAAAAAATGTKATGTKAATKPKAKTLEDLRGAAGAYLSITDKDERETRKAMMAKLNEHYGVSKISEVDAGQYEEVIGYIVMLEKGEVPEILAEADAEDGDALV